MNNEATQARFTTCKLEQLAAAVGIQEFLEVRSIFHWQGPGRFLPVTAQFALPSQETYVLDMGALRCT